MNKGFETYLANKYIFMNRNTLLKLYPDSTYARWGLEINKGWYNILDITCKKISFVLKEHNLSQNSFILLQCKQKFGKLCIYWTLPGEPPFAIIDFIGQGTLDFNDYSSPIRKEIKEIIKEACDEASKTCEFCGSTNESVSLRHDSWVYTLCEDCHQKRLQKIAESKNGK